MKFRMNPGGEIIEGESFADVVDEMLTLKMEAVSSRSRYRERTAQRIEAMFGVKIRTDGDVVFVQDLMKHGLLEKV